MAKITNYGLVEVESLGGAVKAQICFDNKHWWEGFFLKKDGTPNKATIKTLFTCGFNGNDPLELIKGPGSGVLNENKEFDLEFESIEYGDRTIEKVKWVNDPDAPRGNKFSDKVSHAKLGGAKVMQAFSEIAREMQPQKPKIKNHAPGAAEELGFDDSEEISF